MEYWRREGWTDHEIRHWYSVQWLPRNEQGKIIRTKGGKTMSEEKYRKKMERKQIIADREDYRMAVCECFAYMNHRPRCPMGRPSRSPNFGKTPWNDSHGDGLGNHDKT